MTVVLDSSVGIALVRPEVGSSLARLAVDRWSRDRTELVVPSLFWIEVVNALTKGHRTTGATVIEALYELDQIRLTTVDIERPIILAALDLIERWGLTSYDATYLALARARDAELATFDRELIVAGGARVVDLYDGRPHRFAERPTSYGTSAERAVTWPTWPGAGSYLATLRRRATGSAVPGDTA
ncbi:MAG TPA: type II toxin-antitoxin system VapC family toxin [Candidatus Binatia bacterium]|nr:type II toxin-antitoxin system VapC family toxin [Candidatus Binatia bacterium]